MRVETLQDRWSQDQLATGVRFSDWMTVLARNGYRVSPEYAHRLAWLTGLSLGSSALARLESARFGATLDAYTIDTTPLFILGHWRTGTTHMHNMLGRDPNHTFSTLYQVLFPDHFLVSGAWGPKLLKGALPDKRTYDNVAQGWFESAEDEIALMKLTGGLSFYTALLFPDEIARYERYIDFLEATPEERRAWKRAFVTFLKKIMIATGGKRVVVKSCAHAARIRMLLDLFPDAKFIHIHRHPARVFRSMVHMRGKVDWENVMHRPKRSFIEQRWEQTAIVGERLYSRLIADRELIPENQLVEIAYRDLVGHELHTLRDVYAQLDLPDWERFERELVPYLESIRGYKVNPLEIEPELEEFVYDRWRIVYDTYGYAKEYRP